ncbi:MAG: M24 family metallopeptidase [Planctomycetes bacterium]|nr:M24 family metallopeptidase [Planctomycetota bacterium]
MSAARLAVLFAALLAAPFAAVSAQDAAEFAARRDACRKQLAAGQALVLRSATERTARPNADFYYLTGISGPGHALLLAADGHDVLFAPQSRSPRRSPPAAAPGFATVRPFGELEAALAGLRQADRLADERLGSSWLGRLRRVKSAAEIEKLRRAIDITCAAHREVLRAAEPGLYEYQLQALLECVFAWNGAPRPGFPSIVGSGPNSCILHWRETTRATQAGDLVVLDIGAEYAMYTADVTRTFPIGGRFTDRQKQVYEIVLAANEAAIAAVGPGVPMRDVENAAAGALTAGLVRVGVLRDGDRAGLRRYFVHGLRHSTRLQVHDVGGLGTLEPGMVITIEPGLYFRDEGMGVRIEDDVLVTEHGREVLSAAAPKTVAAIEALMAEPGIDVRRLRAQ